MVGDIYLSLSLEILHILRRVPFLASGAFSGSAPTQFFSFQFFLQGLPRWKQHSQYYALFSVR